MNPPLKPTVTAATVLADPTQHTAVLSLWLDADPPALQASDVRFAVISADAATTGIALCLPRGLIIVDLPASLTLTLASCPHPTLVFAIAISHPPSDWWARPMAKPDLVITGPTVDFAEALDDASAPGPAG